MSDARDEMEPGDEAPADEPSAGENICPTCEGSGRVDAGECRVCGGSGFVEQAVGGG